MLDPTRRGQVVGRLIAMQTWIARVRLWLLGAGLAGVAAAGVAGFVFGPDSHGQIIAYRVVIAADLVAIYLWIAVYSLLQPWWRYRIGRNLVGKDIALSVPLLILLVSLWFNFNRLDSQIAGGFDLVALAAVAVYLFTRSDIWVVEHSRRVTEPQGNEPPPPLEPD